MLKRKTGKIILALLAAVTTIVACLPLSATEVKASGIGYSFSYAYDCQRYPDFPKKGDNFEASSFKNPLYSLETSHTTTQGNWTLNYLGYYGDVKTTVQSNEYNGSDILSSITSEIANMYALTSNDSVQVWELKDGSTHVAYGVLCALTQNNAQAAFIGDTWRGGAGYVLSVTELSGTFKTKIDKGIDEIKNEVESGPTTPANDSNVSGRGGDVSVEKLKTDNVGKTVKDTSVAKAAGINDVDTLIDVLSQETDENKADLLQSAITSGSVNINVNKSEATKIGAQIDMSTFLLAALTPQEMVDVLAGNDNITLDLEVCVKEETNVDEGVKAAIDEKATGISGENQKIYYFSADLFITKNGAVKEQISEFGEKMFAITLDIPEELLADGASYVLIRTHEEADGSLSVDVLEDQDDNPATFTFYTNKLCTMAFVSSNNIATSTAAESTPNTADSANLGVYAIVAIAAACVTGLAIYKRVAYK